MVNDIFKIIKKSTNNQEIIFFPFAGGFAYSYNPLFKEIKKCDWGIVSVEPPGHGSSKFPLEPDIDTLINFYVEHLYDYIQNNGNSISLFGHSMGGAVVIELARRLVEAELRIENIIISGLLPPYLNRAKHKFKKYTDQEYIEYMLLTEGLSKDLIAEEKLVEYILPIFKNDLLSMQTFELKEYYNLKSSVNILGGSTDKIAPFNQMHYWRMHIDNISFYEIEGGHMFLLKEKLRLKEILQKIMK
ncbi:thioesterase II family protein [Oceanobacillus kimchii]|uniref:thioesterase II family protein n=1 Tax=Oceanobacillus kimchii TaxID=746691 RepID=UPI003B0240E0